VLCSGASAVHYDGVHRFMYTHSIYIRIYLHIYTYSTTGLVIASSGVSAVYGNTVDRNMYIHSIYIHVDIFLYIYINKYRPFVR